MIPNDLQIFPFNEPFGISESQAPLVNPYLLPVERVDTINETIRHENGKRRITIAEVASTEDSLFSFSPTLPNDAGNRMLDQAPHDESWLSNFSEQLQQTHEDGLANLKNELEQANLLRLRAVKKIDLLEKNLEIKEEYIENASSALSSALKVNNLLLKMIKLKEQEVFLLQNKLADSYENQKASLDKFTENSGTHNDLS